ncbi:MAG: TonB-dependent receptor plug domain-containing protein [Planctomycetia bacterium]|nr:TonB-dependent receptor plug domain-containing protein [Planctomycetia bacterium]
MTGSFSFAHGPRVLFVAGSVFVLGLLLSAGATSGQEPENKDKQPQVLPETKVTAPKAGTPEPPPPPAPEPPPPPPASEVSGRTAPVTNTIGSTISGSQGTFTQADIRNRPLFRTADILEQIPGFLVTDESGEIDANVYFLRGFNLEHGTDFAFFVDNVPINLPSNPHGQGLADIQFLIPELISIVDFGKGPYYAKVGNFSAAGYTNIQYYDALQNGFAKVEAGQYDWFRTVVADSGRVGPGTLLYGVQFNYFNSASLVPAHLNKTSAIFRYTIADEDDRLSLTAMLYNGQTTVDTVIPLRLTERGVDRFTNLSPTDFCVINRFTLNGQWQRRWENDALTQANVYGYRYTFDLFENTTGFVDDPINGDQAQQLDRRWVTGANLAHSWNSWLGGEASRHTVGVQVRHDIMPTNQQNHTVNRVFLSADSDADLTETDTGLYFQNESQWTDKVRTVLGLRGDIYNVDVTNHVVPANSGSKTSAIFLPKGALILGPWVDTEFYLNGGYSFRSSNALGAVATVDADGNPAAPTPLLVQGRGAEVGVRSQAIPNLTTSFALWQLHLQSDTEFDIASNSTEPLRASERYGIESSNTYQLGEWFSLNADYSWSHGRLLGVDPEVPGNFIPGAVTTLFSGGPSVRLPNGLFANLRYRYFGPRYLTEDGSVSSNATSRFDLSAGLDRPNYTLNLQILNVFNNKGHDLDNFETSFWPMFGDTEPADGIVFNPIQPFAARFSVTLRW